MAYDVIVIINSRVFEPLCNEYGRYYHFKTRIQTLFSNIYYTVHAIFHISLVNRILCNIIGSYVNDTKPARSSTKAGVMKSKRLIVAPRKPFKCVFPSRNELIIRFLLICLDMTITHYI